jgi:hypothetical protein
MQTSANESQTSATGSGDNHNRAGTSTTERTQTGGDKRGPANERRRERTSGEGYERAAMSTRASQYKRVGTNERGQTETSKSTERSTNERKAQTGADPTQPSVDKQAGTDVDQQNNGDEHE